MVRRVLFENIQPVASALEVDDLGDDAVGLAEIELLTRVRVIHDTVNLARTILRFPLEDGWMLIKDSVRNGFLRAVDKNCSSIKIEDDVEVCLLDLAPTIGPTGKRSPTIFLDIICLCIKHICTHNKKY